jgi:manganese oxidase
MRFSHLAAAFLLSVAIPVTAQQPPMERVRPNDNRATAGIRGGSVLALRMEARIAEWHPQGEDAPGAAIPVFAEIQKQASIPGPLIRVPGGTEVRLVIRNAIPNTILTVHGLHTRPVVGPAFNDSIQLAYAQIHTLRFKLDRPGTYYYWGTTTSAAFGSRTHDDAQLTGAIVVDEPGERPPRDRIFVIGQWTDTAASELSRHRQRELFVVNGRSWPHTDRLLYEKGETVRWRVINASADMHPMHLHGFHYRITRRGDGKEDTVLGRPEVVNTEPMLPGGTMSLSWVADRLGQWLFHCATPAHHAPRGPMGFAPQSNAALADPAQLANPAITMGGLVSGIEVRYADDDTTAKLPPPPPVEPVRRMRMVLRANAGSTPSTPYYGVAITEAGAGIPPEVDIGQHVGPPVILTRGEPTSVQLVNLLPEPTSIHWHGIESESIYDGVPGWSGIKPQLAPALAPLDSFDVRLTPPRAGTFIYHSHVNDARQQRAGIVGPLIVADKGKWDPTRDFPVLLSSPSDSVEEERAVLINGSLRPAQLELRRATAYRFRLINITTARAGMRVELKQDTTLTTWRPIAKDGADIPAASRGLRTSRQPISIGETMDFEFFATRPGPYVLEARTAMGALLGALPIRVQ